MHVGNKDETLKRSNIFELLDDDQGFGAGSVLSWFGAQATFDFIDIELKMDLS